jgi:hypothetical protein
MNRRPILLACVLASTASLSYGYSGLNGHTLSGTLERSPFYDSAISVLANSSNLGSPLAQVNSGTEFSADFADIVPQQWQLTADFQDNYQVVLNETSPTPQANFTAGGWLVQWHFYGLDFDVGDVQLVSGPEAPWDRSVVSFDADNVWIGFNGLYQELAWSSYTFQIVPVPEPGTLTLGLVGGLLCRGLRRGKVK